MKGKKMIALTKEWNGTLIEVINYTDKARAELRINSRTVDFVEGYDTIPGKNDYMHGYDGENHIEIRFEAKKTFLGYLSRGKTSIFYNGRKIIDGNVSG